MERCTAPFRTLHQNHVLHESACKKNASDNPFKAIEENELLLLLLRMFFDVQHFHSLPYLIFVCSNLKILFVHAPQANFVKKQCLLPSQVSCVAKCSSVFQASRHELIQTLSELSLYSCHN